MSHLSRRTSIVLGALGAFLIPLASMAAPPEAPGLRWETLTAERGDGEAASFELGFLEVPEDRSRPDGRTIEIAFVRLPATAEEPGPPLVYLAGGPGQPATPVIRSARALGSMAPLRALGDVILLDQRGVGRSRPNLDCPSEGPIHPETFLGSEASAQDVRARFARCVEGLRARGIDLAAYDTEASADDLDDLRRALGAESLRLLGFSYGTHLGLAAVRRHGERLERVVLVGTEGPDHTWKLPSTPATQLARLGLLAAADPEIGSAAPDLAAALRHVLRRLETDPVEVRVAGLGSGEDVTVQVGAWGLRRILLADLGDTSDLPYFPALITQLDRGETGLLSWFVTKRYHQYSRGLPAMSLAMDCASGVSPEREARIRAEAEESLFAGVANDLFDILCPVLGDVQLAEAFRAPIVSDVPVLFVSGTLDANTPPFQAEEVRWGMPRAEHLVVVGAAHEDLLSNPSVQRAIGEFLAEGRVESTRIEAPPLDFVALETTGR